MAIPTPFDDAVAYWTSQEPLTFDERRMMQNLQLRQSDWREGWIVGRGALLKEIRSEQLQAAQGDPGR